MKKLLALVLALALTIGCGAFSAVFADGEAAETVIYDVQGKDPVTVRAERSGDRVIVTSDRLLIGVKTKYHGTDADRVTIEVQ